MKDVISINRMKEGFPLNLGVRGLSALICDYQHEQGKEFENSLCNLNVTMEWFSIGNQRVRSLTIRRVLSSM